MLDNRNPLDVLKSDAIFHPAVHGILIENKRVLLQQNEDNGLWYPPGRGLEQGQRPILALSAYFRGLAGFSAEVGPLLFIEDQHQSDATGTMWKISRLYYLVKRPPGMVATIRNDGDGDQPTWVPLHELSREQMQFGYTAIQIGSRRLRS